MKKDFDKKLKIAKDLLGIQGSSGNWNCSSYMLGLYNGMEIIMSIFEGREPKFKDAPAKWLNKLIKSSPESEGEE